MKNRPPHLKKELLRGVVEENVSTIEGKPLPRAGNLRPRSRRRALVFLGLAPFLLAASIHLLRRGTASPVSASPAVAESAEASGSAATAALELDPALEEDPTSQLRFPAPRPIDPSVFPLEVRRVVIDPGHGGEDWGTTSGELAEKDLTLDIARRLRDLLEGSLEVHLTREDDRTLSLRERAELANGLGSDLFLSIHINWLATRNVRGIETYYLGPTDDPELTELVRRENLHSGYTVAQMRPLLESLYTDVLQEQSHRFATRVQRSLFASLLSVNPELRNRGVKTAPFVVLVSTEMPAILAEVSCLSHPREAELVARPLYRQHIAEALARGIRGYAEEINQTEERG